MKTQMKFQKIMCLIMILMGALSAVYCLIYCTGGLTQFGMTVEKADNELGYRLRRNFEVPGQLYIDVQPFNTILLILSIVMIVAGALLYFTATNKRRNYYISNYVTVGVVSGFDIVTSIYILVKNTQFYTRFKNIINDPVLNAEYQNVARRNRNVDYITSAWNFELGYFIYILVIVASVLLILNCVWKFMLMRGEKQLLNGSAVKEVAQ